MTSEGLSTPGFDEDTRDHDTHYQAHGPTEDDDEGEHSKEPRRNE
jgi:hypothetical protein